jgi:hypothetical protein
VLDDVLDGELGVWETCVGSVTGVVDGESLGVDDVEGTDEICGS